MTLEIFLCLQEQVEKKLITNDDVLGDPIPHDQQDAMRLICYQLFDLTPSVCNLQTSSLFSSYAQFAQSILPSWYYHSNIVYSN